MADEVSSRRSIVVLGGSYAGISTAHYLLKHVLPKLPDPNLYQVVLISTSSEMLCRPACPRAMISEDMFDQSKLFVDIVASFKSYPEDSFRFIQGTATELDHQQGRVTVQLSSGAGKKARKYHALVIATGSSSKSNLLGLTEGADELRQNWTSFRQTLASAKHIVIAGGGPAGVETAGELGEYLNGRPGWFGRKPIKPRIEVTLVTSAAQILPALRPAIAKKAESYLTDIGVTVRKNSKVTRNVPRARNSEIHGPPLPPQVISLADGTKLEADIYIPATGTTPNTSYIDASLLADDGRVTTNPSTLRVDQAGPRVYAIGDAASAARPAIHLIFDAVPVLCANIKRDLFLAAGVDGASIESDRVFSEDTRETQMVLIGKSIGVGAALGWQLPSWVVKMIKRDYWLWTTGDLWSGRQWNKEK